MAINKKDNGKYELRYKDGMNVWRRKTFKLRKDAEAFEDKQNWQLRTGRGVDEARSRQPFEIYVQEWYDAQSRSDNHDLNVRSHIKNHILPALGHKPIGQIALIDLQKFVKVLKNKPLAPTSIRTVVSTVKSILAQAEGERVIAHSPTFGLKLPPIPKKRVSPLEVSELCAIAEEIQPCYRALVYLAGTSGLRQAEIFGMQVQDICWDRGSGSIAVERQLQSMTGKPRKVVDHTKTHKDRQLPISDELLDIIEVHLAEFPAGQGGVVFTNSLSNSIHKRIFNRAWLKARNSVAKKMRIDAAERYEPGSRQLLTANSRADKVANITFHQVRHFYASLLIADGVSPRAVSEHLGHANPSMTLSVYTHLWPADYDKARRATSQVFGGEAKKHGSSVAHPDENE